MHIGIDYTAAAWQGAGIGRYTRELIRAVVAQGSTYRYSLFYAAGGIGSENPYISDLRQLCETYPYVRAVPIPISPRRLTQLWQRARLPIPIELFTGQLDLLHATDFVLPPTRARTLVTIHDLSFLLYPQFAAPGMVRYLSSAVPRSVRRANGVLADSKATRNDLIRLLDTDPVRIEVVYPGVDARFRPLPHSETAPIRQKLALPERFLLFISTLEPRKNLVRQLEAFSQLIHPHDSETTAPLNDLKFVIGGRRGWLYDEIFATIERLQLRPHLHLLDFVDDNDLPALYNLAWAFTYPSIYEGFGLPALEALACGTPVLTAGNSSLPEVVGDTAVIVDASDTAAIYDGMRRICIDVALRTRLQANGPLRARQFSWQQAGERILAQYRRLILEPSRRV